MLSAKLLVALVHSVDFQSEMQKYVDINNEHIQTLVFFMYGLTYNEFLKQLKAQKWISNMHKIIMFWGEEPKIVYGWKV